MNIKPDNTQDSRTHGKTETSHVNKQTAGVKILVGDPKAAVRKLALPMIVAMTLLGLYNVVDAFWVSGLGSDALAAIGFVFPFYFVALGLAHGLGVGGGSAISRRIGADDKAGADRVAIHLLVMMGVAALLFTIFFYFAADSIFILIGAGSAAGIATEYGKIIFLGSFFIFFTNVAYAILRGEGDAKRAMYAMGVSSILNIILDPILIYTFNWGIAGAAWATIFSIFISSLVMFYWMVIKKDTYVSFNLRGFTPDKSVIRDILGVGLPASVQQISMAFTMLILNLIIIMVSDTDGVAVYSVGWRLVSIAVTPLIAISTAVVSVAGAAYGSHIYKNTEIAHLYATKLGLIIGLCISAVTFIFAPQIAAVFTLSEASAHIAPDLIIFLRVICLFFPIVTFGMFSSSLFQGTGKGMYALSVTILRTIILAPLFVWLFAVTFGWGLIGVWWGLLAGNTIGSGVAFIFARVYTKRLINLNKGREASV